MKQELWKPATAIAARRAGGLLWALAALPLLLAGCGGSLVRPVDRSPAPLVEPMPLDAGLYLDDEFRAYVYKEKRWNISWQIALGEPGVAHATRMAKASFRSVREVKSLAAVGEPAVALVLAPHIEEFAFVTPRDAGGVLYQVTVRFRMNLHDAQGRLVDSLLYTGYGASDSGVSMGSEAPLTRATELALRDAGAKFLTEFPLQPVVQQVLRGEVPVPVPVPVPVAVPASAPTAAPASEPVPAPPPLDPAAPPPGAPAATAPETSAEFPAATAPETPTESPAAPVAASPKETP